MPARPSPLLLLTIGTALLLGVVGTVSLTLANGLSPVNALILSWLTVTYAVSGLVAWSCRPESRIGPLMLLTGVGGMVSALGQADQSALHTIGQATDVVPLVLIVHVFVTFPTGRLHGRTEKLLIGVGYLAAVPGQLAVMMLGGLQPHALTVVEAPALAVTLHNVVLTTVSAVALGGVALLFTRRRTHGRHLRRSLTLLVDAFALGLVMIAALLIVGAFGGPAFPAVQRISLILLGVAPVAFLAGLLQARLVRSSVGDLVVALQGNPADVRTPLAHALRDPSVVLLYWLPRFGVWAGPDGRPVTLPDEPDRVSLIDDDGEPMAALIHDPALRDEPALLDAVRAAACIALRSGRLQAQLRASVEELRGSRARVLEAGRRERQRLERDLHDGAQQRLVALSLNLGMLQTRLGDDPEAAALLVEARGEIAVSLTELRDLARGLHPAVVSAHGLAVALESLAARAPVPVRLSVDLPRRLDESVEVAAYYVVCESLTNVGKHARASAATVAVSQRNGTMAIEVVDDGCGGADTERGTGLRGLADRVEALGGCLRVWTPAGGGTELRAELPCG
jgi:signal transduction histidine kinase